MMKIVWYLRRIEHWEFRIDREVESRVRRAQRLLDDGRPLRAREDEPKIARTFGEWQQPLIDLRCHLHVDDVRQLAGGVHAVDATEETAARDGNHHHTGSVGFTPPCGSFAECVSEEQFFQRESRAPSPVWYES